MPITDIAAITGLGLTQLAAADRAPVPVPTAATTAGGARPGWRRLSSPHDIGWQDRAVG